MDAHPSPGLYLDPPSFDIELDEFGTLPLCRLEAIRLLREGPQAANELSHGSLAHQALASDARLLLVHGHSDRPSEAKHRRADLVSHFVLRLACCGGIVGSSDGERGAARLEGGEVEERQEEGADWRRERREWFVRAERDLFEARLQWHLHEDGGGSGGRSSRQEPGAPPKTEHTALNDRLDALRVVYSLGWLHPVTMGLNGLQAVGVQANNGGSRSGSRSGTAAGCAEKRRREYPSVEEKIAARARTTTGDAHPSSGASGKKAASKEGSDYSYLSCPFEKVLRLVRSRQVLLLDGQALLTPEQVPVAVVQHFEDVLRKGMAVSERGLPGVEADTRVKDVLRQVRKEVDALVCGRGKRGGDDGRSSVTITRQNIDRVAEKHFPLCMRRTLRILRRDHHLKYKARLQFVSFLANAGMEVGELLDLWREEFPKGMPPAEYARKSNQYEYSLRHLYGLEGKRKAYTPQSCALIASSGWAGSGQGGYGHGCPFHSHRQLPGGYGGHACGGGDPKSVIQGDGDGTGWENRSLRGMLAAQNLPASDIEDIVGPLQSGGSEGGKGGTAAGGGTCSGGRAVSACRRHYAAVHRWVPGGGAWEGLKPTPNGWLAGSTRPQSEVHVMRQEGSS